MSKDLKEKTLAELEQIVAGLGQKNIWHNTLTNSPTKMVQLSMSLHRATAIGLIRRTYGGLLSTYRAYVSE